jgi:hypothetical protein
MFPIDQMLKAASAGLPLKRCEADRFDRGRGVLLGVRDRRQMIFVEFDYPCADLIGELVLQPWQTDRVANRRLLSGPLGRCPSNSLLGLWIGIPVRRDPLAAPGFGSPVKAGQ